MRAIKTMAVAVVVLVLVLDAPPGRAAVPPAAQSWVRHFRTTGLDEAEGAAVDSDGASYAVGETFGTLPGQTPGGTLDAFIRKYDASGAELWTRQFGGGGSDVASGVTVDDTGQVYVVGTTSSPLAQEPRSFDAFVTSFAADGQQLWLRQFGSRADDFGVAVATDPSGNIFVAGSADQMLSDQAAVGGRTAFLRQFDQAGDTQSTDQFGSGAIDEAWDVAVASNGAAYLVGTTERVLAGQRSAGRIDAFVRRYDRSGTEAWTHQYGTPEDDYALAAAVTPDNGIVIAGSTRGTLGERSSGNLDAHAFWLEAPSNQ